MQHWHDSSRRDREHYQHIAVNIKRVRHLKDFFNIILWVILLGFVVWWFSFLFLWGFLFWGWFFFFGQAIFPQKSKWRTNNCSDSMKSVHHVYRGVRREDFSLEQNQTKVTYAMQSINHHYKVTFSLKNFFPWPENRLSKSSLKYRHLIVHQREKKRLLTWCCYHGTD